MSIKKVLTSTLITILFLIALLAGIVAALAYYGSLPEEEKVTLNTSDWIVESALNTPLNMPDVNVDYKELPSQYTIDVECILQNPELPSGCEVTSLAILLNHLGIEADKTILAADYLEKASAGTSSMYDAFIGTPDSKSGYGCYAPVIVRCALNYLSDKNITGYKIYNLTGSEFDNLLYEIAEGNPVIVWSTISLAKPYSSSNWNLGDEIVQWFANEHCVVLTGYNLEENIVYVSDPLHGNVTYDMELFKTRYNDMFRQAICIY